MADSDSDSSKPLALHKDNLNAKSLDPKDPYVTSAIPLFAIHNILRRALYACSLNSAPLLPSSPTLPAFLTYAQHTLFLLTDQLTSASTIWFPHLASYDPRFTSAIAAHTPLHALISALSPLLTPQTFDPATVSRAFADLAATGHETYDAEEALTNSLGHAVPLPEIHALEAQQEARRKKAEKEKGVLWSTVFVLKALTVKEREVFPPGVPILVLGGILTAGSLQYRRWVFSVGG